MYPIEHAGTWLTFSIGFLIFFLLPLKHKTLLILLFFITGIAIGMYEHITFQDETSYDKQIFDNLVVKVKERVTNPWNQALCIFLKNDGNRCPDKYDVRWKNWTYFGE